MNTLIIDGRLAHTPELKFSRNGNAICKLRLAHTPRQKNDSGEWEDGETLWLNITMFGKRGEHLADDPAFSKGALVQATGRLTLDEWEAKDGIRKSAINIIADAVTAYPSSKKATHTTPVGSGVWNSERQTQEQAPAFPPPNNNAPF